MEKIILRMIHACGMPDVIDDLAWHGDVSAAAAASLLAGHRIYVDAKMVAAGLMNKYLPTSTKITCSLDNPKTSLMAVTGQTTRSAAAVDLWDRIPGSIVVVVTRPLLSSDYWRGWSRTSSASRHHCSARWVYWRGREQTSAGKLRHRHSIRHFTRPSGWNSHSRGSYERHYLISSDE